MLNRDQRLLFLAALLWGFGDGLWLHLQPLYVAYLGAEPWQIGSALALAGVAGLFVFIPAGLMADRWRRKPIIFGGYLTATLAAVLVATAPQWRWVIPGLALFNIANASRPATHGYIASCARSGNVGRSFAFVLSGYPLGGIPSPAIGGWIAQQFSLRVVLVCAVTVYAFSTLAVSRLTNLPAPRETRKIALGRLLSDPLFLWQILVVMIIIFALDVGVVLTPNYLMQVKGLSIGQVGQLGTFASLGVVTLTLGLGSLQAGRRTALILSQLALVVALSLILGAPTVARAGAVPLVLVLAYWLRSGDRTVGPAVAGRLSLWLQPDILSAGYGFRDTATQLAQTLAPLVAGQLYARNPSWPLYGGLIALAISLLLTLTLPRISYGTSNGAASTLRSPSK